MLHIYLFQKHRPTYLLVLFGTSARHALLVLCSCATAQRNSPTCARIVSASLSLWCAEDCLFVCTRSFGLTRIYTRSLNNPCCFRTFFFCHFFYFLSNLALSSCSPSYTPIPCSLLFPAPLLVHAPLPFHNPPLNSPPRLRVDLALLLSLREKTMGVRMHHTPTGVWNVGAASITDVRRVLAV